MKKICLLLLLTIFTLAGCTGETNLFSLIPDSVQRTKKGLVPPPTEIELLYDYSTLDIATLQDTYPGTISVFLEEYFSNHKNINKRQLLQLLNTNEKFILQRNSNVDLGGGTAEFSYKKIYKKAQAIGDVLFYGAYFHGEVGSGFGYGLAYIEKNEIFYFTLFARIVEKDKSVFSSLPEIFIKKNGKWYWKNGNNSVSELYALMESHDKRLPDVFLELQDDWEHILANLKIDGVKVEIR